MSIQKKLSEKSLNQLFTFSIALLILSGLVIIVSLTMGFVVLGILPSFLLFFCGCFVGEIAKEKAVSDL